MIFPNINPTIISVGPLSITWYSLAYVGGIIAGWIYAIKIAREFKVGITKKELEDFISWAIFGIIMGGRLGYVLLYDPIKYFGDPISILKTYEGGMSFHGGILGLAVSSYYFCQKHKINLLTFSDVLVVVAPIGLFLGRIANFINGELYGRVTQMPWGVIFPNSDLQVRHPSQLYEAFFEGIILFVVLTYATFKYKTIKISGLNSGIFLMLYSLFRITIEILREPDFHIGFLLNYLTMGQILSLPMLILGGYLIIRTQCQSTQR
jgi:phosphatidylglycerol:prolipoprotein diacylglycerol transferase